MPIRSLTFALDDGTEVSVTDAADVAKQMVAGQTWHLVRVVPPGGAPQMIPVVLEDPGDIEPACRDALQALLSPRQLAELGAFLLSADKPTGRIDRWT